MMQPGGKSAPLLRATWILPSATMLVAKSMMNGVSSPVGTPIAIGFVPSRPLEPPNGTTDPPSRLPPPVRVVPGQVCADQVPGHFLGDMARGSHRLEQPPAEGVQIGRRKAMHRCHDWVLLVRRSGVLTLTLTLTLTRFERRERVRV